MNKCKGCKTSRLLFENGIKLSKCIVKNNAPKRKCPCEDCLIKVTCYIQCDNFSQCVKSIFNIHISYNYKYIIQPRYSFNERAIYLLIR